MATIPNAERRNPAYRPLAPSSPPGPRPDAEPADHLPVLRVGVHTLPVGCRSCGGVNDVDLPVGADRFGRLVCSLCGRQAAWLVAGPREPARHALPDPVASVTPVMSVVSVVSSGPTLDGWRLPTCGPACRRPHHDPITHELAGRQALLAEQAAAADRLAVPVVRTGLLVVDLGAARCTVAGAEVHLSLREWQILSALARRRGAVVAHHDLVGAAFGAAEAQRMAGARVRRAIDRYHVIRVNMARLRARLGPAAAAIVTYPGRGYCLRADPPAAEAGS